MKQVIDHGHGVSLVIDTDAKRKCGECNLCCKLVPVVELKKLAGQKCQHQKFKKGCTVYNSPKMPMCCSLWSCRWLVNDETADLRRPDHSRVVLDLMPDFVTSVDNETGDKQDIEVIQVWVDPQHRDAWKDPALLAYLDKQGEKGIAAIIRFSSSDGFPLFPPSITGNGWREIHDGQKRPERPIAEYARGLGGLRHSSAEVMKVS